MCFTAQAADRVLRVQAGFCHNDNVITAPEDILIVKIGEAPCTEITDIAERVISDAGNYGGSPPGYSTGLTVLQAPGEDQDDLIPINKNIQSDLRWWLQEASSHNGRPLLISQWELAIESDASKQGWGPAAKKRVLRDRGQ